MAVMSEIPKGFVMVQLDCYEMNGDTNIIVLKFEISVPSMQKTLILMCSCS